MRLRRVWSMVTLLFSCLVTTALFAQTVNVTSGSINGRLVDSGGGVLPGVSVKATGLDTGLTRDVVSEKDGTYVINLLPPGRYRVNAELSGLGKASLGNVVVLLGNSTRADLEIAPQLTESLTVVATTPTVDTSRTGTAMSVTSDQIANLPLLGRDFKALAALTPGVVEAFGGRITSNGARGVASDYNIDGATSNNDFFGENTGGTRAPFTFSQAAIQEFQVIRSQYDAEYGRGVGAQLNAITKSGTNEFHGEGFLFRRSRDWATRRPLFLGDCPSGAQSIGVTLDCRAVVDSFRAKDSTQAGFAFGGPIAKNRIFFFGNFDSQRQSLPTLVTDARTSTQFQALPATLQQQFLAKFEAYIGHPYADELDVNQTFDQNTYMGKADANIDAKTRVSVRDNFTNFTSGNNQGSSHLSNQGIGHDKFNQLVGQVMTAWSAGLINEALLQYSTDERPITPVFAGNSALPGTEFRITGLTSGNLFFGQRDSLPNNTRERKVQVKDTVRRTVGSHGLKAGTELLFMHIDNLFPSNRNGQYQYSSVANYVNDSPATFLQGYGAGGGETSWNQDTYAVFVSDNFRPIPRITVDAGLRYDWQTMPKPAANVFPQHPEFITAIHEDKNNVAPRLGVAWDLVGDGTSVVRGGSGKFFGYMPDILLSNPLTQISGNFLQGSISCAAANNPVPCPTFPNVLTPAQFAQLAVSAGTNIVTISPAYEAQEAWRSNVQFERRLGTGYSAAISTTYSKLSKVQGSRNVNAVKTPTVLGDLPVYDIVNPGRRYPDMSVVRELCSCEEATYKDLTLETHKRTQTSYTPAWDVSYTWSRSIDEDTNERSTSTSFLFDPTHPALSRGPSDNDVAHRVVGNVMYRVPWGNIDVAAIFQFRSGVPYNGGIAFSQNGVAGSPTSLNGLSQTSGNIPVFVDSSGAIIDLMLANGFTRQQLADFLAARGARIIGRNAFRQPNWHTVDLRVSKVFAIPNAPRELKAQLIAEGFNLLNTQNLTVGSANQNRFNATLNAAGVYTFTSFAGPTGFGVTSGYASTPDPRQFQVAVKVLF